MELPKAYNPKEVEDKIYKLWEESGFFTPENLPGTRKDIFSVALPPPNATGTLHLGHALEYSIQDAVVRYHRMKGEKVLWLPGTDHAAIATNTKVEKMLIKEEGKNRHDIGREAFVKKVEDFVAESRGTMQKQLRQMGASLDWSREAFTMDAERNLAVRTAFKRMYDAGLIYRGYRVINWDPKGQTTVSDDEIVYEERKTKFYTFKYGPFEISTTRPETKFGDKYVVMHPKDKRYANYAQGQTIKLEWINGPIEATVIKDEAIDMEFGTGVMTITPWHTSIDFEIAERHKLDKEQIIDKYGKLLPIAGEFTGMKINDAREKIVEKLKIKGLLVSVDENYVNRVATAERSGGIIEPQIMLQWFVAVNKEFKIEKSFISGIKSGSKTTLKEIMKKSVENGQIEIMPDRFEKTYFHWINNLRDWNISRQLWYGHRIPVWYHEPKCVPRKGHEGDIVKCKEVIVSETKPKCEFCDAEFVQDEDTLDTWFSSALWTFATLGWPDENAPDLKTYHPTTFMNPGYEILFFWVARMILMSGFLLGEIPFKTVYLHGILRDAKGRKFSKSLDNGLDPIDIINQYGTDALRMSVVVGIAPGNDGNFSLDKVKAYKHFANKLWNIARFVLMSVPNDASDIMDARLTPEDEKILTKLGTFVKGITEHMDNYRLYLAAEEIYHYVWHTFADKIIEESKAKLASEDPGVKSSAQRMLMEMLITSLKLLHPFMPFVTEEIYSKLPIKDKKLLLIETWPV